MRCRKFRRSAFDFAAFGRLFDRAAGFFDGGCSCGKRHRPNQVAQVGEILQQVGGVQMVQAEFLQAGRVDEEAVGGKVVHLGVCGGVFAGIECGGEASRAGVFTAEQGVW